MNDPFMNELAPEDQAMLDQVVENVQDRALKMAGYPCNQRYDYTALKDLLNVSANNIGDPWQNSNFSANTLELERDLLVMFGRWLHMPEEEMWGYVTGGGTEGNMYGLYLARELHPDGIVYYSQDTHYSVTKIIHVLGMRSIMIRSQESGEFDYQDLKETLKFNRDKPPIIFANIGTTMKQAVDHLPTIRQLLQELAIGEYYLHADAAFTGGYFPFIDNPPPYDFREGIDSIAISGHKFIGCPNPCGIAMAKKSNVQRIGRRIEYIGAMDTTIPGSRSALTPALLWYTLKSRGEEGMRALASQCLRVADHTVKKMHEAGIQAWKHDQSLTVVFPRPGDHLIRQWSIAPYQDYAHIITVGHVDEAMIDQIVADLSADNALMQRQQAHMSRESTQSQAVPEHQLPKMQMGKAS